MSDRRQRAGDWQHRIRANFPFLVEHLSRLEDLSDHLISRHIFSPHDADVVQNGGTDHTQRACSRRFLHRLLAKAGPNAYPTFTEALERIRCGFIVDKLESTDISQPCHDLSYHGGSTRSSWNSNTREEDILDVQAASDDMQAVGGSLRFSSGAGGYEESTPTTTGPHGYPVQNVYVNVNRPKQVIVGPTSLGAGQFTGDQNMCRESMLIALLNEILFRCAGRKEALYTLEGKLCTKLRDVGQNIVCFEQKFDMSFGQFLARNSEHFDVTKQDNDLIVSRAKDRKGTVTSLQTSFSNDDAKERLEQDYKGGNNETSVEDAHTTSDRTEVKNTQSQIPQSTPVGISQRIESDRLRSTKKLSEKATQHKEKTLGASCPRPAENSGLMEALASFQRGHYVLVCGSLPDVAENLYALSNVPWVAVYDFDVNGRHTGLLAYLEEGLKKTRSFLVSTWMDPHTGVTERGTQWWSLRGRHDVPKSNLKDLTPMKWIKKVCDKVEELCRELARFSTDYTIFTILVLWPNVKDEVKCITKFLNEMIKRTQTPPRIILWFTDSLAGQSGSQEVESLIEDSEENVLTFERGMEDFCKEVQLLFTSSEDDVFKYEVPAAEGTHAEITKERAAWLKQNVEVLYLTKKPGLTEITAAQLQAEADNFFRGGSLSWMARYDMGTSCCDVERDISKNITNHIWKVFITGFRSGVVRLCHAPGAGGSTMAQRVLFDLHENAPCVHIRQNSGSSLEQIAERLEFLYETTHMPVVALVDGEEEQKLQQLNTMLLQCAVVFLYVRRYPHQIDLSNLCIELKSTFFLPGTVTKQESRNLCFQFGNRCNVSRVKARALATLDNDVQKHVRDHQMFEYGMTVYNHEFLGVKSFVKGYLQIERKQGAALESWQKCLGYLSLFYYYAQSSLPCYFIGSKFLGESGKTILDEEDLPFEVRVFVVADANKDKRHYVRIMHYTIATEILEQILNTSGDRSGNEKLSEGAKQNLLKFCLEFFEEATKGEVIHSSFTLQTLLTETFILRDFAESSVFETESKKKMQFAQVMLDMDTKPPYDGRLKVLTKMCDACPDDANFRAHLGRFYSLCRPGEEEEAERNFKEAIKIANENKKSTRSCSIDLAYIYHMYGCFFQRKISRNIKSSRNMSSSDLTEDAANACEKFSLCRQHAPLFNREAHPYFAEIDIRLQACRWIGQHCPGGLLAILQGMPEFPSECQFVKDSIVEIGDLIVECNSGVHLDDSHLLELQHRVQDFNSLFKNYVSELQAVADNDPMTTLRLKIMAKKLQYDNYHHIIFVENPKIPSDVLETVVGMLEKIFKHKDHQHCDKTKLDLDYRDWILAIRNPNLGKEYLLEDVLRFVQKWHTCLNSAYSSFYMFVLFSILGFGTKSGCIERGNGDLQLKLGKWMDTNGPQWSRGLKSVVHSINTSVSSATGTTPYELVFGQKPRSDQAVWEEFAAQGIVREEDLPNDLLVMLPTMRQEGAVVQSVSEEDAVIESLSQEGAVVESLSQEGAVVESLSQEGAVVQSVSEEDAVVESLSQEGAVVESLSQEGAVVESLSQEGAVVESLNHDGAVVQSVWLDNVGRVVLSQEDTAVSQRSAVVQSGSQSDISCEDDERITVWSEVVFDTVLQPVNNSLPTPGPSTAGADRSSEAVNFQDPLGPSLSTPEQHATGATSNLEKARDMKKVMQKLSRGEPKARLPKEWLGRDETRNILHLIPQSRIRLERYKLQRAARGSLAVCKGTILGNPKKSAGYINMDLKDKDSSHAVEVFFVPVRSRTSGTFYQEARVQFYLSFNQTNGYEAFEVLELQRAQCPACKIWVEITTDQQSVTCHGRTRGDRRCGTDVFRQVTR